MTTATTDALGRAYDYADMLDDLAAQYDAGGLAWDVFSQRIDTIHAKADKDGALDMALEIRATRHAERFA